jgi:hypothetical protein
MNPNSNIFGFPPGPTDWLEAFLSSVGRLLALASDFDFHCHALADKLELSERKRGGPSILGLESVELFDEFLRAVTSRENMKVIRQIHDEKITAEGKRRLVARGRRAYHKARGGLASGLKYTSSHESGRASLLKELIKTTHDLAESDRFVATLVMTTLGGQMPPASEYSSYVERSEQWVLNPVEGLISGKG